MDASLHSKENSPRLWQIPPLLRDHHKYDRGHVALMGGSAMTGAAKLVALSAQRVGAGMVTLAAPRAVWPIYAISMQSIITTPLDGAKDWLALLSTRKVSAVALGPGMAPDQVLGGAMTAALKKKLPMVLDAGALTVLANSAPLRKAIKGSGAVLTPHEGEYEKLAAAMKLDRKASKATRVAALAKALGCVVLLKGPDTFIAAPDDQLVRNETHAPWLATAGAGDVLTGLITGLLAQGMASFHAACAGAYLHSKAALVFSRGMIPEDLLQEIPRQLRLLK